MMGVIKVRASTVVTDLDAEARHFVAADLNTGASLSQCKFLSKLDSA